MVGSLLCSLLTLGVHHLEAWSILHDEPTLAPAFHAAKTMGSGFSNNLRATQILTLN